jgi:fibronectin type 3 domain-containing protein
MATLENNRDERANSIVTYYSGLTTYNSNIVADGDDTEADKPQMKFKAFNDLIKLHHDELKLSIGYASHSSAYLSSDEGVVGVGTWWNNANSANNTAELFYIDSQTSPETFMVNGKSVVNQKHPYLLWNQYNTAIGGVAGMGDFGWKNAASKSSYTPTSNPFIASSYFLLGEPLEHYGNTANLLWGKIVYDGVYAYRATRMSDSTAYTTHADSGFANYGTPVLNIGSRGTPFTDANRWPSKFDVFRNTQWGAGSNISTTIGSITSHTATAETGTFTVSGEIQTLTTGWYSIYKAADVAKGWVIYVETATPVGFAPVTDWIYTYSNAYWPTPITNDFFGSGWTVYASPIIDASTKTAATATGKRKIWTSICSQYLTSFKSALDGITVAAQAWSTSLDAIINFDYTVINQEAGSDLGKADSQTLKTNIDSWVTSWKSLIHDTGSGATFSTLDANWATASLDAIMSQLDIMVDFTTNYTGNITGYIGTRKTQTYSLLGDYSLGTSEQWEPTTSQLVYNNSGSLTAGSLYFYRHIYADERLNREDGTLTNAYGGYTLYNQKILDIAALEVTLSAQTSDYKYDITPIGTTTSYDEEDQIVVSWEQTKGAATYDIERKEGYNGTWTRIETAYDYVDPGDTPYPDFSHNPTADYYDTAYTKGYQEFGLTITSEDDPTSLTSDFTLYDFKVSVDGATAVTVSIKGMDADTWDALRVAISNAFTNLSIEATPSIVSGDFRITSNKKGAGSTIAITSGTTNDLLTALSYVPSTAVDGITDLEQGKVYYYRIRANNGWGDSYVAPSSIPGSLVLYGTIPELRFGSDGDRDDKDWDSKSDWQYTEYSGDKATHGDGGMITWDEPANLAVSGVDDGVTASTSYCRLEWDAAENASSYKIYRATSTDGGYAYLGSTSNTYYNDTTGIAGFVYYYKIKAVADSYQQLFDSSENFSGPIEGAISAAGIRGKRLWAATTLTASTDDGDALTLSWSAVSGATGYVIYKCLTEDGEFAYISNDDATDMVVTTTSYVDAQAARQFFIKEFTSTSDGISASDYTVSHRYYFVVFCSGTNYESTVQQYYITSPASGTWTCQSIATAIQAAITAGLNNATCSLVLMQNPEPANYRIRFTTNSLGTSAFIRILDGTFGDSLLPLLDNMTGPEAGQGAYQAIPTYYKVEAVEVVAGEIVRRSELSNIAQGVRPVI